MALTSAQKASIRLYMGAPSRYYQVQTSLEQAMLTVDGSDAETQAIVVGLIASLVDVDAKLLDAHNRLKAKKVGSIELTLDGELMSLRSEGRRFVGRLASVLGVEVTHDVFSGSSPSIEKINCNDLCIG